MSTSTSPSQATTRVPSDELPPWLRTRGRLRKRDVALESVDLKVAEPLDHTSSKFQPAEHNATSADVSRPPSLCPAPLGRRAPVLKANKSSAESVKRQQVLACPDSWEEGLASDATTEVPEDCGPVEDLDVVDTAGCQEVCSQDMPGEGLTEDLAEAVEERAMEDRFLPKPSCTRGAHSRFRKDLVNLNKAVPKWLRQEEVGEITHDQVLQNIKGSIVAQKLRQSHGDEFDESGFVQDVLARAAKLAHDKSAKASRVTK